MVCCVSYSSLETVDWSLYKFGGEGVTLSPPQLPYGGIDYKFP